MLERLRRWAVSPLVGERYVHDVAVAPEALASRLRSRINVRPKRLFGVLKVRAEWVGLVAGNEFVVWERRQHATRAVGEIRGRRGGSRVEAHIGITRAARILTMVFFALFTAASVGFLAREDGLGLGPAGLSVLAVGLLVTLSFYWSASLRQRKALRSFLDGVFTGPQPG